MGQVLKLKKHLKEGNATHFIEEKCRVQLQRKLERVEEL